VAKFVPCQTVEELKAASLAGVLYRCYDEEGNPFLSRWNGGMSADEAQAHLDGSLGILVEDTEDG